MPYTFFSLFTDVVTKQSINDNHLTALPVCVMPSPSSTSVPPPSLPPLLNPEPTTPTSMDDNENFSLPDLGPEVPIPQLHCLSPLDINQPIDQPRLRGQLSNPYGKLYQTHNSNIIMHTLSAAYD